MGALPCGEVLISDEDQALLATRPARHVAQPSDCRWEFYHAPLASILE